MEPDMSKHARSALVAASLCFAPFTGFATPAGAAPPSPLDTPQFSFPGVFDQPSSGLSAGVALADRWLGDDPSSNPAAPRASRFTASPALLRVSRQDLRADNSDYDETPAFFDAAGATL